MADRLFNRNFVLVLISNALLGAPMPMLIILGGLCGILLAPYPTLATMPVSAQMLAGLLTAAPMSLFMGRYGRKPGFLLAAGLAFLGGACGALALYVSSFWMLCLGHGFLGAALVSFGYFRFAAAEVVHEKWRPTAISFALGAGLVAAIIGPEIFARTKDLFALVPFAGAYLAISAISFVGALFVLISSFPKPVAKASIKATGDGTKSAILKRPKVLIAVGGAAISYAVMVLLMTPTPLAMVGCGFNADQAGDVIRWHVIAMFAPSFVTGFLIQRFGSVSIVLCGALLLGASAIVAISGLQIFNFYVALIILGIGWNFGFIGSTAMLAESVNAGERAVIQGTNDTVIALASTIASFGAGVLIGAFNWTTVAFIALPLVTLMILIVSFSAFNRKLDVAT